MLRTAFLAARSRAWLIVKYVLFLGVPVIGGLTVGLCDRAIAAPTPDNPSQASCRTAADNLVLFAEARIPGSRSLRMADNDARVFVASAMTQFPPPEGSEPFPPISVLTVFFVPNGNPEVQVRFYGADGCDIGVMASMDQHTLESIIKGMGTGI